MPHRRHHIHRQTRRNNPHGYGHKSKPKLGATPKPSRHQQATYTRLYSHTLRSSVRSLFIWETSFVLPRSYPHSFMICFSILSPMIPSYAPPLPLTYSLLVTGTLLVFHSLIVCLTTKVSLLVRSVITFSPYGFYI